MSVSTKSESSKYTVFPHANNFYFFRSTFHANHHATKFFPMKKSFLSIPLSLLGVRPVIGEMNCWQIFPRRKGGIMFFAMILRALLLVGFNFPPQCFTLRHNWTERGTCPHTLHKRKSPNLMLLTSWRQLLSPRIERFKGRGHSRAEQYQSKAQASTRKSSSGS